MLRFVNVIDFNERHPMNVDASFHRRVAGFACLERRLFVNEIPAWRLAGPIIAEHELDEEPSAHDRLAELEARKTLIEAFETKFLERVESLLPAKTVSDREIALRIHFETNLRRTSCATTKWMIEARGEENLCWTEGDAKASMAALTRQAEDGLAFIEALPKRKSGKNAATWVVIADDGGADDKTIRVRADSQKQAIRDAIELDAIISIILGKREPFANKTRIIAVTMEPTKLPDGVISGIEDEADLAIRKIALETRKRRAENFRLNARENQT